MQLVTPELGLFFWQLIAFLLVFVVLAKYAWKPILSSLKERETNIENALQEAQNAKIEMAKITAQNNDLLERARFEKDEIMKKALQDAKNLVEEAKNTAQKQANKLVEEARQVIESERKLAVAEIKKQISSLSIEIAEKVLRKELTDATTQKNLVETLINDAKLN